ncbi:uncharacterized protein LOC109802610 [Cajanus cajan]|uniref:uncharacterized protein LOC109802610 n=1 Tax=Cajanus cajan TaxID=3821 RepID=UPI00098D9B5F|nr:uncharacterized protein LOC109802610 [Cajanus cajan]
MEQQEGDTWTMPPFWAAEHRDRRRLRRSYSLLLTSTSLLLLFLVLVLVFSLILVPTLHSFASNILRPRTVKNSWDSLNLVLVLFAIVCGFLGRNNANETVTPRSHYHNHRTFSNPSTPPPHCYHYNHSHTPYRSFNRLRSFNSYPDLRQQIAGEERFRFYDDTFLLRHHPQDGEIKEMVIEHVATAPPQSPPSQAVRRNVMPASQVETIQKHEETDIDGKISPPRSSAATRPKSVRRNFNRAYQVEAIEKHETNDLPAMDSPQPSPPSTRTKGVRRRSAYRTNHAETIEKRKTNDLDLENSQSPPSPPSATQTKDVRRSVNPERNDMVVKSSPLSPPSLPAEVKTVTATASVSNKKENSSYNVMTTGNESPLIPIPPPPPPPPFKLPAWKFRVKGDYVRVDSIGSSRSGSPDLDEASVDTPTTSTHDETSQCNSPFARDGEDSASVSAPSLFCPSPDVDTKAHNFIESFRAGLRMAKMNSMKERQGIGRSNLGPSPNHEW